MPAFITKLLSVFLILSFVQSARAQSNANDTARVVVSTIKMPQLNRERTIRVLLPAGYTSSKKRYPVLYMHDGQNLFTGNTSFAGSWLVDSTLKTFPADKQFIVVGIDNGSQYRIAEYTPYDNKYAKAQGDAYIAFIVRTLKPHIDSMYRTKPAASYTAIAGSSLGGLISMYAAIKYPGVFGAAGVFSPSFWIAPPLYQLTADTKISTGKRFFLTCGDMEGDHEDADVMRMDSVLIKKGFGRTNVPAPLIIKGAKHNEQQWRRSFKDFYAWLVR